MSTTNVNPKNAVEPPADQLGTDITTQSASEIVNTIRQQFVEGATAVVIHDHDGRTGRLTPDSQLEADANDVVATDENDELTVRIPARTLHTAAATDAEHAGLALDTRVTITYESQYSQSGEQSRTGTITDWSAKRTGSVYKLTLETDDGDRYHYWTTTRAVQKGRDRLRKVGHNATLERMEDDD